jgi:hypothetical protein
MTSRLALGVAALLCVGTAANADTFTLSTSDASGFPSLAKRDRDGGV